MSACPVPVGGSATVCRTRGQRTGEETNNKHTKTKENTDKTETASALGQCYALGTNAFDVSTQIVCARTTVIGDERCVWQSNIVG